MPDTPTREPLEQRVALHFVMGENTPLEDAREVIAAVQAAAEPVDRGCCPCCDACETVNLVRAALLEATS